MKVEIKVSYQASESDDESTRVVLRIQLRDGERLIREFDLTHAYLMTHQR